MAGGKRRRLPDAAAAATKKRHRRRRSSPSIPHLSASLSAALRFRSSVDLVLSAPQSLALESAIFSASRSLSRLIAVASHKSILPPPPTPSLSTPPWFLRLLSASSSFAPASAAAAHRLFADTFRMHKKPFYFLLENLFPSLSFSNIPPERVLGAAVFRLAHAAPFKSISHKFGLPSASAACKCFYVFIKAIISHLGEFLDMSMGNLEEVEEGFEQLDLPNCKGVIGFSKFPIIRSVNNEEFMITQAVVDSDGCFLGISAGWPGSMPPSEILLNSQLYRARYELLDRSSVVKLPRGGSVPPYFLGDSCCPLLPWLLTPYRKGSSGVLSQEEEESFNAVHERGMDVIKQTFKQLKERWRLLSAGWKEELAPALPFVVAASCLLHNFLIKCGEIEKAVDSKVGDENEGDFEEFDGKGDKGGERVRNLLAKHFSEVSQTN